MQVAVGFRGEPRVHASVVLAVFHVLGNDSPDEVSWCQGLGFVTRAGVILSRIMKAAASAGGIASPAWNL